MHSLEARIRKQQSNLICSGLGMILFGAWSIVRFILMVFFKDGFIYDALNSIEAVQNIPRDLMFNIIIAIVLFFLFIDFFIRIYVGRVAIGVGRGRYRKHIAYIIIAIIYAAVILSSDINALIGHINTGGEMREYVEILIDMTVNIATVEIIIAAIRLRILEKKNSQQEVE